MVHFAQIGNFDPEHSTENELRRAIGAAGHTVDTFQENEPGIFDTVAEQVGDYGLVLWTRTGWDPPVPHDEQRAMLEAAMAAAVPTVGYHLDRWFGLSRESQVRSEPFFRCAYLFTADGGHQHQFERAGVNHHWLPPAVSEFECNGGTPRDEYRADIAFVGSWLPGYHREWKHRPKLVKFLRDAYGDRARFFPAKGEPAVRCEALRDLYASTKVNVGDSCLAGGATRYWSDRIPETIGRGGFLLHPNVEGLTDHFTPGEHLATWDLNDWGTLGELIDRYIDDTAERERIAKAGQAHVLANHTYTVRIGQVLEVVL